MADNKTIIERLSFIKYLYKVAVNQSHMSEPLCSASILFFHDSIELYLQLASEVLEVGKKTEAFMEYWTLFEKKIVGGLGQQQAMGRLNKARVALKHHGNRPSGLDIEAFRAMTTNFFEDNTPVIFDVRFADISMIELVQYLDAKENLRDAEKMLAEARIDDSLVKAALAYEHLIADYVNKEKVQFGWSLGERPAFSSGDLLRSLVSRGADLDSQLVSHIDQAINHLIEVLNDEMQELQHYIRIIGSGIDYRRYARFRHLTPLVSLALDGHPYIHKFERDRQPSEEDARFCIDFVIESALTLQQLGKMG